MPCKEFSKIRWQARLARQREWRNNRQRIYAVLFFRTVFITLNRRRLRRIIQLSPVYWIARNRGTTMMILSGIAINMLLGSAIALLLSNAESPWRQRSFIAGYKAHLLGQN